MKDLEIEVLGGLSVRCEGHPVKLPASRKARAMLAFLLLTGKPQHRERLCDLFWEGPDDPRGALRSALWKLRRLLNEPEAERIVADRETVRFEPVSVQIDYKNLTERAERQLELAGQEFADVRAALDQPLLAGLDLPDHDHYQAWLTAMREEAEALRARLMPDLGARTGSRLDRTGQLHLARQKIGFAHTKGGTRIAWARIGSGPPLLKAANWLNHLELDWDSEVWSPLFQELARDHTLIRYDGRGNGMSDWEVANLKFDSFVTDLEGVVAQSGIDRFPLLGISQGAAVAIEYAARNPDRVSHLILWGGYAAGWRVDDESTESRAEREALITLVANGWGRDDASYRNLFSRALIPGATEAERTAFDEFQRKTVSAANAARFLETFADIDVRHRLDAIQCRTLVMHARGDQRVPVAKGAELASGISGAEFVTLPTDNHLLLGREHSSELFVAHVRQFLSDQAGTA
ncbi:alpha/beta hydrolase [Parasphingorhabdus cellanae]|uniref:Alpha/beta fold hydrolase n=1 Tax=Parasphingorhabdus cellanae TaxID=2806553 RepID=A0ABX7T3Z9_9SPHN|nr:alpha/beta hydrolase [Parasphingorhabdus cellanae]QTD55229.1 alpha/beta fold hydrolase [Parasphingorhabdus cellanae]